MNSEAARVAFVTPAPLAERPEGLYSDDAAVRREILLPARLLQEHGVRTHVISLPAWPVEEALALLSSVDCAVFGAPLAGCAGVLARLPGAVRVALCASANEIEQPQFHGLAARSFACIASSSALKSVLQQTVACPVHVYPQPAEFAAHAAHVRRQRLVERAGLWIARRLAIGFEPWRIRLLWFDHPASAPALLRALPDLRALARTMPLALECVTGRGTGLEYHVNASPSADLALRLMDWSHDYVNIALAHCDAVLAPQLSADRQWRLKSNARLVDALHAGRFMLAQPIPSYEELSQFAWIGDSLAEGVRWLMRSPDEALRRLTAGQRHVLEYHGTEALADFWFGALGLTRPVTPAV